MTRAMRRASESNGRRLQAKPWDAFRDVTAEARVRHIALGGNPKFNPDGVFLNSQFVVQLFFNREVLGLRATKAMVRRCDAQPIHSWQDLQRVKNEVFGPESTAIEVYPPQSKLVDDANLYWLWVLTP